MWKIYCGLTTLWLALDQKIVSRRDNSLHGWLAKLYWDRLIIYSRGERITFRADTKFRDRRGAASLRYRNRAVITVLCHV